MDIRAFQPADIAPVKAIFDQFYSKDVDFPDLLSNFLCAYVVEEDGRIITAGGVRTITEICLMTDKNVSSRKRFEALIEVLGVSKYICREFRFDWLHAITDDPNWANQMKRNGFVSRGEALEIQVGGVK